MSPWLLALWMQVEDLVGWLWDAHLFSSQVVAKEMPPKMMTAITTGMRRLAWGEDAALHNIGMTSSVLVLCGCTSLG